MNVILLGTPGSLAAGLMTAVGALPVMVGRSVSQRINDILLGFAAGVMLSASYFSLIITGLEIAGDQFGEGAIPALITVGGVILGATAIYLLDERVPHQPFIKGLEGPASDSLRKIWLFVIAITLHNVPEGLVSGGFSRPIPYVKKAVCDGGSDRSRRDLTRLSRLHVRIVCTGCLDSPFCRRQG